MDCTWSEWEILEACNCETGNKKLSRFQIKEQFGGKPCTGDSIMVQPCDEDELPGEYALFSIPHQTEKPSLSWNTIKVIKDNM